MTEQRQKIRQILTELESYHDYLFTDDDIPTILDKIEAVICNTRCCTKLSEHKCVFKYYPASDIKMCDCGKTKQLNA